VITSGGGALARIGVLEPATARSRRWIVLVGALVLAGGSAFLMWRMTTLSGLPDIGDPFEVAAFGRPIPDDSNAFVLYKKAFSKLGEVPANATGLWASAGPDERRWLAENREALSLWKLGTARPDALYVPPAKQNLATGLPVVQGLRDFSLLASLEGSRLEAEGDLDGALDWYLAILRSSRHCGRGGPGIQRMVSCGLGKIGMDRLLGLVDGQKLDARSLRRLLDAVIEADAMTPPASDAIKGEYLMLANSFADPAFDDPLALIESPPAAWSTGPGRTIVGVARRVMQEPERSRRVYRLIVANWLAYCDRPKSTRPVLGPPGSPPTAGSPITNSTLLLYKVEPDAPEALKRLTTEDIKSWYESSLYLRFLMVRSGQLARVIDSDRLSMANLTVTVANELCKKERGQYPEHVEELVGPYLKSLPEAYKPID
jgi:hypothetical protein